MRLNQLTETKHVEPKAEYWRTRVQLPPPPPIILPITSENDDKALFFRAFLFILPPVTSSNIRYHTVIYVGIYDGISDTDNTDTVKKAN